MGPPSCSPPSVGEDIPDPPVPALELELELVDDADPAASFPTLRECFSADCIDPSPGVT